MGLGAALGFITIVVVASTAYKLINRYTLKNTEPFAYAFLLNAVSTLLFLPFALRDWALPREPVAWAVLAIASILWTALAIVSFIAYKGTDVSIKDPLGQSKLILTFIFGVVFLKEAASVGSFVGTLAIFAGVCLLVWHPEKRLGRLSDPGVRWTFLGAVLAAILAIIDKFALNWFSPDVYVFLVYLAPTLIFAYFLPGRAQHIRHLLRRHPIASWVGIVLNAATYYFIVQTYAVADIILAYPLLQLGTLFATLGGIIILKEREHFWQRIIASVIIVAGAIIVGL